MSTSYTTKTKLQHAFSFTPPASTVYVDGYVPDVSSDLLAALQAKGIDTSGIANLSPKVLEEILAPYWNHYKKLFRTDHTFDVDSFVTDYAAMLDALESRPEAPDYEQFWDEALAKANEEAEDALAELAGITKQREDSFNEELRGLASSYNTARSGILSSQYRQNAQLMDTMTSQLDKQNRNALEAGASAGLRLAGNINTLLSTQNKQSQLSLDTANQLAQMMVSQRNAEASVRGQYGDYMTQNFNTQQGIKNSAFDRAGSYYDRTSDIADKSYDKAVSDWDNSNYTNPLWEYKNTIKPKYDKTGG